MYIVILSGIKTVRDKRDIINLGFRFHMYSRRWCKIVDNIYDSTIQKIKSENKYKLTIKEVNGDTVY